MGLCASTPYSEEEIKNMKVLDRMFEIWGQGMMSKDPSKFDAVKDICAEGCVTTNTAQEFPQAKAFFTSEPGPEGMAQWMKDSFLAAKFEPITATALPQGSFMLGKLAIGNKVYFRNHMRGYKMGDKTWDNGETFIEYYTLEFTPDNKIKTFEGVYDKEVAGKMAAALFGEASAAA